MTKNILPGTTYFSFFSRNYFSYGYFCFNKYLDPGEL